MVFAHGVGGAADLPIPAAFAIAGASAALAVSFIVLALAWRSPRYDGETSGRPAPGWLSAVVDAPVFAWTLRLLGLAFFLYVAWAAFAGPDLLTNPTFGVVYVLLWVGIVPASLLFGPFYKAISPVRTIHLALSRLLGGDPARGIVDLPRWVGYWPAALGLFAFVWLELVYPESTYLTPVRLWFAVYLASMLVGSALFGSRWLERADPFEVYSTLVGHLSVFGRRDGALVVRSPLANLDTITPAPGLVAVVAVLFGSTAFDSFAGSSYWLQFTQTTSLDVTGVNTAVLLGFCAVVGTSLALATTVAAPSEGVRRADLPALFAHSVVPIIVGYMVAHYLTYFVESGQQTLILLSDPLGTGQANYLGTADWTVSYWLTSHPTLLASLKVLAVVVGHVLGVIAAHDRAIRLLPRRDQVSGQLPLLLVMVFYTVTGLFLLFGA